MAVSSINCKYGTICRENVSIFISLNTARGVMVIVAGIGHGDTSSNPGPD